MTVVAWKEFRGQGKAVVSGGWEHQNTRGGKSMIRWARALSIVPFLFVCLLIV